MENKADTIKGLYSQIDNFILIGLTGRTGAGCSTTAKILSTKEFQNLDLPSYKSCDFNNSNERKYSIIYRFMKEGNRWLPFVIIEASSIIFSYVLESKYSNLFGFIDNLNKQGNIHADLEQLKIELICSLSNKNDKKNINIDEFLDKVIDEEAVEYIKCLEEQKCSVECQKEVITYFTEILMLKKKNFQNLLKNYLYEKDGEDIEDKQIFNLYTYIMQIIGNNIRSSGYYDCSCEKPGLETNVVTRIDKLIQFIKNCNDKQGQKTRICIDALRNSVEILYFRDRYRAFYVFAVNTEDSDRQNRLGMNQKEIKGLDMIEYPDEDSIFYHQNIQACLEISDIYLYNPNTYDHKYFPLTEQILKYIALILQPGLVTPTHLERCMQLAFNAKYNSGCLSRQVGAVVTGNDFSVRSVGWNDVPKGQVSCSLRCVEDYCKNKDSETFSEFELSDTIFDKTMEKINEKLNDDKIKKNKSGKYFSYCFKDIYNGRKKEKNQVHTRSLHAEENAFLQIAKYGGAKISGGKLFTTASPCELCSKKAYQLGIEEIYYIDPYPGLSKKHILSFGKTCNPKMILFQGAIGNAYIALYSPRMPYKDEISLITGINATDVSNNVYLEFENNN